jgi:RNA polymerase sigma-70 factor, ECF subfamily
MDFAPSAFCGISAAMDRVESQLRGSTAGSELAGVLTAIASGDREALSTLYQRTSTKLYGICLRVVGEEAEAQDVLQDVYVTVWRKAAQFDSGKASAITWLAVLARNKAIDQLRRRRAPADQLEAATGVADGSPSAFDVAESRETRERLAGCLDELEEQPRAMIRSAFLDGASYPELAEREGVPLGTMKSWIRRGLQRLKGCLER